MTAVNPALRMVSRGAHSVQIGLGPGGLILEGLQASDVAFINALRRGIADKKVVSSAVELGVPAARAQEICTMLDTVLCPDAELSTQGYRAERLRPDRTALLGLYRDSAQKRLAQRQQNVVHVAGLGRTGATLAGALANAGVGTLLLEDDSPVAASDVSPSAYTKADIGIPRSLALRRHLTALDPLTHIHMVHDGGAGGPSLQSLDLAVLVGFDCAAVGLTSRFLGTERPHLLVLHREQDGTVGPLVVPGETACAGCVERQRNGPESPWLQGDGDGPLAGPTAGPSAGRLEASATSLALAGTAATQALLFLDGVNQPSAWSAVLSFHSGSGRWTEQEFSAHPECGCQWQNQPATISRTASP
ncbi:ThiF family adenylyltransferase [Specibacter sp. NPDC078692]|uniref:ThiF family adenylyltransferase n=1 Tax=Specibacter sp. NPDC078692 TaxID=3155818 RepID=UPI003419CA84